MTFSKRIRAISSKNTWKGIYLLELVLFFIGPNLAASIPQAQKHFFSFLPTQKNAGSFVLKRFTHIEIEAEILSIPLNKVYRLYSGATCILKCASKIISRPSMETYQQFNSDWYLPVEIKICHCRFNL